MKFGGSSVGSVESIRLAVSVVFDSLNAHPVVILSAMGGVTDSLMETGDKAFRGLGSDVDEGVSALREIHENALAELITTSDLRDEVRDKLEPIWEEIQKVFTCVLLLNALRVPRDLRNNIYPWS